MNFNWGKKVEKDNDELTELDKRKKLIGLAIYIAIFIIIVIYVNVVPANNFSSNTNNNNNNAVENNAERNEIDTMISKITNNYLEKITIKVDLEEYILEREVDEEREIGVIVDKGEKTNYIKNGLKKYSVDESGIEANDELNLFDGYDITFTKIENIKELLNTAKEKVDITEEKYNIKRYKTTLSEVLTIYNKYNNTLIGTNKNEEIIVNIAYNENIEYIEINLTELYKSLNKEVKEVLYKIEYSKIGSIDLGDIEKLVEN